ncbi:hypothetical protein SODALDRAFT_357657 [Sodiomyces alkalinus F11]|uniref:Uncharacterized protein n=1 Tax=Sodiomyces alkalinus (strain CBS 110278 / VKM F-3762 / F11) TaxID=1314773 RepID=A0A3N2Q4F5_SODAK|nr:hypothetical protein SODALDRAFT_357657 [Sodiomyces alkalinus F11]ROT41596.1 hypothetical protein SODALDRAFT_357657 [Sodiomyces alkalinus F11]
MTHGDPVFPRQIAGPESRACHDEHRVGMRYDNLGRIIMLIAVAGQRNLQTNKFAARSSASLSGVAKSPMPPIRIALDVIKLGPQTISPLNLEYASVFPYWDDDPPTWVLLIGTVGPLRHAPFPWEFLGETTGGGGAGPAVIRTAGGGETRIDDIVVSLPTTPRRSDRGSTSTGSNPANHPQNQEPSWRLVVRNGKEANVYY